MEEKKDEGRGDLETYLISRRQFLKVAGIAGAAIGMGAGLGGLLAACGKEVETTTTAGAATTAGASTTVSVATTAATTVAPTTTTAAGPKQGGTLRLGIPGGGTDDTLDAHLPLTLATGARIRALYDQLTQVNANFELENTLVESVESNATADQWTIRLKQGVEFHNGKTLNADDVIYSFQRILDPKVGAFGASQLACIDLPSLKKLDDLTVQVKTVKPFATFDLALGDGGVTAIVPVGYDPANPVGTGPFKVKSFTPGEQSVFERFPNYHGGPAYVDELVMIDLTDDAARVNALLAGQVDAIGGVPYAQIAVVKQNADCTIFEYETGNFNPITMRVDTPPFDDVRVRQALRLCIDRDQAVQAGLSGHGTYASDSYSPNDPAFDKALVRTRDIEQAKSLLKQAGKEKLEVELVTSRIAAGIVETCSVLAANAADAGVTIKVREVDIGTFYGNYFQWPFAVDWWTAFYYLTTASVADGPGAALNSTHFNDPEYNKVFDQAEAELDATKRGELIRQLQKIQFDRGGLIIPYYTHVVDAYRKNVAGQREKNLTGGSLGTPHGYEKLYLL